MGAGGGVDDRVGDRVLCRAGAVPVPTDSDGIIHILGAESPGGLFVARAVRTRNKGHRN